MDKKKKGFSLAELLISLLIISIVLSAAIPTITKRAGANREYIWRWASTNNDMYTATGWNQTAVLGYDKNPVNDIYALGGETAKLEDLLRDFMTATGDEPSGTIPWRYRGVIGPVNFEEIPYSKDGDKFTILKKPLVATNASDQSNFANSHISFYTTVNQTSTTNDIRYAGRIAMDPDNIAIGKGSLQNQLLYAEDNRLDGKENMAVGHFSMFRNINGSRNTALGHRTLSFIEEGKYNTAMGFGSLFQLGSTKIEGGSAPIEQGFENTAIGALSQEYNNVGVKNTSVGSQSLKSLVYTPGVYAATHKFGDRNTALGWASMFNLVSGDENTALGANACGGLQQGSNNICIGNDANYKKRGYYAFYDNNGVYIGSGTVSGAAPLIEGHSERTVGSKLAPYGNSSPSASDLRDISEIEYRSDDSEHYNKTKYNFFHQELIVNARNVRFRTYDGQVDVFKFQSMRGPDDDDTQGYDSTKTAWGIASFNLRDTMSMESSGHDDKTSVSLTFSADDKGVNNKTANIMALDPYHHTSTDTDRLADINFNNLLNFSFPQAFDTTTGVKAKVYIDGKHYPETGDPTSQPLIIQHIAEIQNNHPNWNSTDLPLTIAFGPLNPGSLNDYVITLKPKSEKTEIRLRSRTDGSLEEYYYTQKYTPNNSYRIAQKYKQSGGAEKEAYFHIDKGHLNLNDFSGIDMQTQGKLYMHGENESLIHLGATGAGTTISPTDVCISGGAKCLSSISSDARLKNITGDNTAGLKEINELQVKNFTYKNDKEKKPQVGVIAQQIQKIFPTAVSKDEKGYLRIRTEEIFYAMVNAIKELTVKIQDLTAKVTGLDKRITELEKQNKQLIEQNKAIQEQNKAIEKRLAKLEKQSAK